MLVISVLPKKAPLPIDFVSGAIEDIKPESVNRISVSSLS